MRVAENAPLAPLTTLKLGGPARRLVVAETEEELVTLASEARLFVGGGSNLVLPDEGVDGTVVQVATRGIERHGDHFVVAAGESWDAFVALAVADGYAGVECLGGIPGCVGATPMQNVGAYGQDVSDTIVRVRTWDRREKKVAVFDRAGCRFAYRSSIFRGSDRHLILDVTFALGRQAAAIRYAELVNAVGESASAERILRTVVELRRKKGMVLDAADPDTRSAGSFFTNPIVGSSFDLPAGISSFPATDGRRKVSAAWLIERSGFAKGFRKGNAGISSKHALALVNHGGTTAELLSLAADIQAGVADHFGISLEIEPIVIRANRT